MTLTKLMLTLTACLTLIACEPCDYDHDDTSEETGAETEAVDLECLPGATDCVCEVGDLYPVCNVPHNACVDNVCVECNPGTLDCECTGGNGVTCIEPGLTCVEGKCRA